MTEAHAWQTCYAKDPKRPFAARYGLLASGRLFIVLERAFPARERPEPGCELWELPAAKRVIQTILSREDEVARGGLLTSAEHASFELSMLKWALDASFFAPQLRSCNIIANRGVLWRAEGGTSVGV